MEYSTINSFLNLSKMSNNLNNTDWRIRKKANNIICRIKINQIKYIKNKYNFSYNIILLSILLFNLFKSLKKSILSLNVAIIYAFENNTAFNNYGGIIINIPRIENFELLCCKINKVYKKNIKNIYSSYFITNVINTKKNFLKINVI